MNTFTHKNRDISNDIHNHYRTQEQQSSHAKGRNHKQHSYSVSYSEASDTRIVNKQKGSSLEIQVQHHSSSEDEEQISSRNELRQKTKELHQILNQRKDLGGMLIARTEVLPTTQGGRNSDNETVMDSVNADLDSGTSDKEKHVKHVILAPDHRALSGNESSGVEMCKKLFGIVVLEYSNGKNKWNHIGKDCKLVVQGVLEGSASHSSGRIHRGDMLVRINDVDVTWLNFTRLLNSLHKRKKVKLTFQCPRIVGPKSSYSILRVPEADLCLAVAGRNLTHIQSELSGIPCVALYLTLVRSSSEAETDEKEDVIYAFPPEEEPLTALRGLFVTLSSVLVDVMDQSASCSHLVLNGSIVNVAYKQVGSDVLVFVMPEDRVPVISLTAVLDSFCSLLVLLFSDVKSAFSDCDRNWLDKILALMFSEALGLYSGTQSCQTKMPFWPSDTLNLAGRDYHFVKTLNLSHENKLICDEILTEYEAMDFDDYMDSKNLFSRRQYTIRGTSLYYKDYVLCSHVLPEQQRDINLFMNCHGLLTLSLRQRVDQVLVWQELKLYSSHETSFPVGYKPSHTRSFLMIQGLNHYYLATVLDAGGCSQPVQGQTHPGPLFIEQGNATLAQLETDEVHMSQYCEERLTNTRGSVSLASADKLCRVTSPRNRTLSRDAAGLGQVGESQRHPLTPTKPFSKSTFSRSKSVDRLDDKSDAGTASGMKRQGSKLSYGSNDSAGSGSSTGPKSKGSRVSSVADLSGISRSLSVLHIDTPHDVFREGRLSRSKETTLFSFVHLDSAEGIIISPTEAELIDVHSSLQQQVMENFSHACCRIRALFSQMIADRSKVQSLFRTSAAEEDDHFREVGILFCCTLQPPADKKRQITTLHYWVVGRKWTSPSSQEMYICFHESTDQSLVEMAFTLGFGV